MKRALFAFMVVLAAGGCSRSDRTEIKHRSEEAKNELRDGWDEFAARGEYTFERAEDGALVFWRETKRVAGEAEERIEDGAVLASVKSKLLADRDVAGNDINVDVNDGVVTMTGRVDSIAEAQRAVELAFETRGVERVVTNLTY